MRRSVAAGLLLLCAYVGLSFLNSPRGFLGTDTGGKVATLKVMADSGRFDPDVGYWAEQWDPTGALHPLAYTSRTTSGRWVNVTTLPALWVGWLLYRIGGYRAALLVPMAGSIAAGFAGLALLRRMAVGERSAWRGFWLLGLASPLTIYALDFWEHSLGVALMGWAVVLLVDVVARFSWWRAAAAGALFGAAATLRTESLVYLAVAVVVAVVMAKRRLSGLLTGALLLAGAAVPVLANEALERRIVGSTVRATRVAGTALGIGDNPGGRIEEAATTLLGLEATPAGLVLGAAFVALLVLAARRRDPAFALAALAGAAALVAVRAVSSGLGFIPGLATAWVLPAAVASRPFGRDEFGMPNSSRPNARNIALAVALGALPIVLATQFRGGAAPQWAGRYLLVSGFLLAVVGWAALAERSPRVAAAFAGVAVAVTAFGLAWTSVRTHDVARTIAALESRPEPVLVSNVFHLAREGGATYGEKRWLTIGESGRANDVVEAVDGDEVDVFATVQLPDERPLVFAGFTAGTTTDLRLFHGVDLVVTRWTRDP